MTDHQHDTDEQDDDLLEGCQLEEHELEDEETSDLRALFPDGLDTPDLDTVAQGYRDLAVLDA